MARPFRRLRKWQRVIGVVRLAYGEVMGRSPALFRPRRYTEKIQWRKLFDASPIHRVFSDKAASRRFVAKRLGEAVLPPLLWAGDDPDAVPFETLTPPYVVKCSHASGFNLFVREEAGLDIDAARGQLKTWLATDFAALSIQPAYKTRHPSLLVERLITASPTELEEFKIFVFDGVAKLTLHRLNFSDQRSNRSQRYYDMDWRPIEIRIRKIVTGTDSPRPAHFATMIGMAETLGRGFDHVRVDFLVGAGRLVVGEITLYHDNGFVPFEDDAHDLMIGAWWRLPRPASRAAWAMLTRSAPASKGAALKWRKLARRRARRAARQA